MPETPESPVKTPARGSIRLLLPLLGWYRWAIPAVIALGVFSALAEGVGISFFIPLLQGISSSSATTVSGGGLVGSLERLFNGIPPERRLVVVSACIFGSILLKTTLQLAHSVLSSWLDAKIGHRLRAGIFEQLLNIGYSFIQQDQGGKLLNTLSTETWRVGTALFTLVSLITTSCTLLVYVVLLFLISWQFTLFVGVTMLLISGLVKVITRRVERLGQTATQANGQLAERMLHGLWGMKLIRTFGRERYELQRFDRASQHVSRTFFKLGVISATVNPVYEVLTAGLLVLILMTAARQPQNLSVVLVFIFILYRLQPQIKSVDQMRVSLLSATAGIDEVMSLLSRANKPYLTSGTVAHRALNQSIELRDVTFTYNTRDKAALDGVSLHIPAGKTTAMVGPSGAGKSTIIDLILRFYDPDRGTILIDDEPLPHLELASWREKIAVVSQDIYIFSSTIAENIAYGKLDATREEIIAAAQQADAHNFIMRLPQGYDTMVGNQGMQLSGGQKQRVTLARAIVRDPQLLILDEATNALDSISENLIQDALDQLSGTRTIIIVAHRLTTIERADHIVVLEEGQVREEGRFQELVQGNGLFAHLYELQNKRVLSSSLRSIQSPAE
jgi:subfamily B ATP-binding cassette protein MsbA